MADDATWEALKNAVVRPEKDAANNSILSETHAAANRLYLDTIPLVQITKPAAAPPENTPANNIANTVSTIINDGGLPLMRSENRSAEFGLSLMNSKSNNFQPADRSAISEPLRFPGKTEPKDYAPGVYLKFKF